MNEPNAFPCAVQSAQCDKYPDCACGALNKREPSAEAVAYSITLEGKHVGNIHERKERADFERCALENLYPHHKRTVVALYPPEALQAAEERGREQGRREVLEKLKMLGNAEEIKLLSACLLGAELALRGHFAESPQTGQEKEAERFRDCFQTTPEAEQDRQDAELYRELIMAVGKKFPGESRHQTALRYIRQADSHAIGNLTQMCAEKEGRG